MSAEKLSQILDVSREVLNDGEYLRVANFLGTLHKPAEEVHTISRIEETPFSGCLEFDTFKDAHFRIEVQRVFIIIYRGPKANEIKVAGKVNDVPFETDITDFGRCWARRFKFYGVKNIKRCCDGMPTEEFSNWKSWMKYLQQREDDDLEEGDEPNDVNEFADGYVTRHLFGLVELEY
jgi:hypothetical protein